MFTKNLKEELTLEELRRIHKAISYEVKHNKELTEEEIRKLRILYQRVLFD